jgi:hypothetical protein
MNADFVILSAKQQFSVFGQLFINWLNMTSYLQAIYVF